VVRIGELVALTIFASACGPRADDYPLLRADAVYPTGPIEDDELKPTNTIEHDPLEPWDESGAGPLTGIFAVQVIAKMKVVIDVEVRQLYRMRLLQQGGGMRVRMQLCRLVLPKVAGVAELTVPLVAELAMRKQASESEGAFLSTDGASFTPPAFAVQLGKSSADDDGDGKPGITLLAKTVLCERQEQIYAALRAGVTLVGAVKNDAIAGEATPVLEQSVLGISAPCLSAAANLPIAAQPGSTFAAKRATAAAPLDIDGNGNITCGEIVAASATLFGK
jgi:hypothetical protein